MHAVTRSLLQRIQSLVPSDKANVSTKNERDVRPETTKDTSIGTGECENEVVSDASNEEVLRVLRFLENSVCDMLSSYPTTITQDEHILRELQERQDQDRKQGHRRILYPLSSIESTYIMTSNTAQNPLLSVTTGISDSIDNSANSINIKDDGHTSFVNVHQYAACLRFRVEKKRVLQLAREVLQTAIEMQVN